jgi:hypothetical protein
VSQSEAEAVAAKNRVAESEIRSRLDIENILGFSIGLTSSSHGLDCVDDQS